MACAYYFEAKPNVFVTSGMPNDYQFLYTGTNFKHSYRFS